jgi:dTDP-4-amino-4,6-dideoxygalactose transaminase
VSVATAIPLHRVNAPPGAEERLTEVLSSGYVADGATVREFEAALGAWIGNPRVVTVGEYSGGIALALQLFGVGPGDAVLATPDACLGTNMPILWRFARPVWVDVDPATGNLDATDLARRVRPGCKAVVLAHWGGDPADVAAVSAVAREHGLRVVEDASEALGAEVAGRRVGATGTDVTVLSFGPVRHLTTGEGAALLWADGEEAERARRLKRYGIDQPSFRDGDGEIDPRSDIPVPGPNSYLNNLGAALGLAGLERLDAILALHRDNARFYDGALAGIDGIALMRRRPGDATASWVYTLRAERRDELLRALHAGGVRASRLHLRNDAYSAFGTGLADLPGVAEFSASRLCLPSGWWVGEEERERVVAVIRAGW